MKAEETKVELELAVAKEALTAALQAIGEVDPYHNIDDGGYSDGFLARAALRAFVAVSKVEASSRFSLDGRHIVATAMLNSFSFPWKEVEEVHPYAVGSRWIVGFVQTCLMLNAASDLSAACCDMEQLGDEQAQFVLSRFDLINPSRASSDESTA